MKIDVQRKNPRHPASGIKANHQKGRPKRSPLYNYTAINKEEWDLEIKVQKKLNPIKPNIIRAIASFYLA